MKSASKNGISEPQIEGEENECENTKKDEVSKMNLLQDANANLELTDEEGIGKTNATVQATLIANETEEAETNCIGEGKF